MEGRGILQWGGMAFYGRTGMQWDEGLEFWRFGSGFCCGRPRIGLGRGRDRDAMAESPTLQSPMKGMDQKLEPRTMSILFQHVRLQ